MPKYLVNSKICCNFARFFAGYVGMPLPAEAGFPD